MTGRHPGPAGYYLTTLGRPAQAGLDMLGRLTMPIKALSSTL